MSEIYLKFESMRIQIQSLISVFEGIAPSQWQESYDNSGLLVGNAQDYVSKALLCLDCTPEIIEEARIQGCDLVIAHHPIIFGGLKRLNGNNYVEKTVINAIKYGIAIYAIHTNLDNVLKYGVNAKIAEKLGLNNAKILDPQLNRLFRLSIYVPKENLEQVKEAVFQAGAGKIGNYDECGFSTMGEGSFRPIEGANPHTGKIGVRHEDPEIKFEVTVTDALKDGVIRSMLAAHPYEEVAYELVKMENKHQEIGAGLIGELEKELDIDAFLELLKNKMELSFVKFTKTKNKKIKTVAVCGGAGSFLIKKAKSTADAYVTSDIKYHEFFDAEGELLLCDIGHYESEKYTIEIFHQIISEKLPNFATIFAQTNTNPVQYK